MRRAEALRGLARTDVRAALTIAGLLVVVLAVQSVALYAYVARESLEEADRWMGHALRAIALRVERGEALDMSVRDLRDSLPGEAVAVRLRDASGALVSEWGEWPPESRQIGPQRRASATAMAWLRNRRPRLVGSHSLHDGRLLEVALPLSHFHSESSEIGRRIALVALLSAAAALVTGLAASRHAFAPLRRATGVLRHVDAGSLGQRLPTRGTGDPVDLHAETLNRVLARIDAAFERLRAFSSDAAHELRTPLNRIANVAEVALQSGDSRELQAALETIRSSTDELSQMVQSLLLLAELGDRRMALPWPTLDVDEWIARSVEMYSPSFEEQGVTLAAKSDAGRIEGDRMLLDRVLVNLFDNALGCVPRGGRVEVQAQRGPGGVVVQVDDSGPGIPESERERIFERFERGRSAGRASHGLGLAIARAVARLHGGELGAESSPLGGARFVLRLPGQRAGDTLVRRV
jgi:two-component system heavy metal sensor histidine kinase CusS